MKKTRITWLILLMGLLTVLMGKISPAKALTADKFGIHIMRIDELPMARTFFNDLGLKSMRGFEYELAWLDKKIPQKLEVFITETGWQDNRMTQQWLSNYYEYSFNHIWSDDRVKAATPFILKGDPGPFTSFSFLTNQDQPTHQFMSLQTAIGRLKIAHQLSLNQTN